MRNSAGQVEGFISISRDITQRKSDETTRADEFLILQKHSQVTPAMGYQFRIRPDGSFSFPFIGKASYVIYGLSPDEVKAKPSRLFDCVHPDDSKRLWDSVLESQETLLLGLKTIESICLTNQSVGCMDIRNQSVKVTVRPCGMAL